MCNGTLDLELDFALDDLDFLGSLRTCRALDLADALADALDAFGMTGLGSTNSNGCQTPWARIAADKFDDRAIFMSLQMSNSLKAQPLPQLTSWGCDGSLRTKPNTLPISAPLSWE